MPSLCLRSFGLAAFVLALAACGPTPDPKDIIQCDAYWLVNAYVWLDEDANGIRDEGEEPLPSVTGKAVDAQGRGVHGATSDAQGIAALESMIPCWEGYFEIFAEVPPGYRLTTEPRVRSSWTEQRPIHFGVIRDDSIATPTPLS